MEKKKKRKKKVNFARTKVGSQKASIITERIAL